MESSFHLEMEGNNEIFDKSTDEILSQIPLEELSKDLDDFKNIHVPKKARFSLPTTEDELKKLPNVLMLIQ